MSIQGPDARSLSRDMPAADPLCPVVRFYRKRRDRSTYRPIILVSSSSHLIAKRQCSVFSHTARLSETAIKYHIMFKYLKLIFFCTTSTKNFAQTYFHSTELWKKQKGLLLIETRVVRRLAFSDSRCSRPDTKTKRRAVKFVDSSAFSCWSTSGLLVINYRQVISIIGRKRW